MEQLIFVSLLLGIGYGVGSHNEKKHFVSLLKREDRNKNRPSVNMRNTPLLGKQIAYSTLAMGSTVVSIDYFKRFLASLRMIFGGRLSSYESLLDRARREALLRMKESHKDADIFLNVRIETSSISKGQKKTVGSIEVLAYGTAVKFES
jgi:uncharacterized protein YbjQ (UPF0145 family)